jgi:hypothetical protein
MSDAAGHLALVFEDADDGWDGGGAGELVEQFDDGFRVRPLFLELSVVQGEFVGSEFPVSPHVVEGVPDDGIEPVEGLSEGEEPPDGDVVPLEVSEFVEEDVPQFDR